jgi:colanic acid biosynthesis glycosyl transferase WcaI
MKKLVFINRYFYPDISATSQILSDLVFELPKDSFNIHIITSRLKYNDGSVSLTKAERIKGVQISRVWTTGFGRSNLILRAIDYISFYLSSTIALFRLTDKNSIIIAKTDPPLISIFALLVAKYKKAILINWLQDLFPEVPQKLGIKIFQGFLGTFLLKLRNISLKEAQINIVLGQKMKDLIISYGVPEAKVKVIHNWADGESIVPIAKEDNILKKEWGLEGNFVFEYSGNMGLAHEFDLIFSAASALKANKNITFLFIGDGAQKVLLEKKAREDSMENIVFKPYQERNMLKESLGVGDVHFISLNPKLEGLIVPSKFYGIIASGRPSLFIGDKNGEISNLILHNKCGYYLEKNDSEGLVHLINEIIKSKEEIYCFSKNARKAFDQKFAMPIALKKWVQILNNL